MRSQGISQFYLHIARVINHTCLCFPSRSWYSFTDLGGMEGRRCGIYTVSQKNIPDVFSYNSRMHWRIFIIFGRNVTEKASNHMLLHFSTSPNYCFYTTLWNWKHGNCVFHVNVACWFANRHTSHIGIIT